jgi:hypothetical protein
MKIGPKPADQKKANGATAIAIRIPAIIILADENETMPRVPHTHSLRRWRVGILSKLWSLAPGLYTFRIVNVT